MTAARCLRHLVLPLLLSAVAFCAAGLPNDAGRVGGYDFAYLLGGDAAARPVQVFDDGQDTFLQFRTGQPAPAVFAVRAGVPQLVAVVQAGPYLRVPQLHGRLLLQLGRAQATVVHARAEREDAPPLQQRDANGQVQPYAGGSLPPGTRLQVALPAADRSKAGPGAASENSYATPARGDRVRWSETDPDAEGSTHAIAFARGSRLLTREAQLTLVRLVQGAGAGARFTVTGRDDDSDVEGLERDRAHALRDALRQAGVALDHVMLRTGPMQAAARPGLWESTVQVLPERVRPAPAARVAAGPAPRQTPATPAAPPTPAAPTATSSAPLVPAGGFTLGAADGSVAGAVRRWAQALNYQLVWDAPLALDAPITGAVTLQAESLAPALDLLLQGLQAQGYALQVTLHPNRVIRFTAAAPATAAPASPPAPSAPALPRAPASPPQRADPPATQPLLRAGAAATS